MSTCCNVCSKSVSLLIGLHVCQLASQLEPYSLSRYDDLEARVNLAQRSQSYKIEDLCLILN